MEKKRIISKRNGVRCYTRALKNARYLKSVDPQTFDKGDTAGGFGTGIPLDILGRIHRTRPDSPAINRYPELTAFLRANKVPAPQRNARDALFSGTVYFAQVTFQTSTGNLSMSTADMNTIIQYAQHAIVPISEYASQYGPNTVSVSPNPITYTANVPSGTFTDGDLQGWCNDMTTNQGLPANSCIYVICPTGISANEVGGNSGYHSWANNHPYIVAGVYTTGLTLQDTVDQYAMVISHEMAEMIVDPKVDGQNPEVCDCCDINCSNLTRVYFDASDNYLGVNQSTPPGGFTYAYYICAISKPEGAADCPAPTADCQYAPVTQFCEFVMNKTTYGKDEAGLIPSFPTAFWLQFGGFTNQELGLLSPADLQNNPNPAPTFTVTLNDSLNTGLTATQLTTISENLPTISFGPGSIIPSDPTLQQNPGNPMYPYSLNFTSRAAFDALLADQSAIITLGVSFTVGQITRTDSANIELIAGENPYFEDINVAAPHDFPSWLSFDLRFFKMTVPSGMQSSRFGATMTTNAADAPGFIANVIGNLTSGGGVVGGDSFEGGLSQDEDASALEFLQQDDSGNYVFNFAVARVRLKGLTAGAKAVKVRVFFRLFQAQTTSSSFDPNTSYRFHSDGTLNGVTVPLMGVQNDGSGNPQYVTIPCFATPRVNLNSPASMTTQPEDTPNAYTINVVPNVEVDSFFGCWLDINQPGQKFLPLAPPSGNFDGPFSGSLFSINEVITRSPHQCLIAEIRYDDAPIPFGADSGHSDKLAQRNIAWIDGPNPGSVLSRQMPHPFEVRPTPAQADAPDELLVFWGNTPAGSTGSFYLPAFNSADILSLANGLYPTNNLTAGDPHTIQCPAGGGVTCIPLPKGVGRVSGLLTITLPPGIKKGETFTVVARQVTNVKATVKTTPPPPVIGRANATPLADKALNEQGPPATTFNWKQLLGAFQVTMVISTKDQLLVREERLLAWLLWIQKSIPVTSRWFPVFQRYIQQISDRVQEFGGNPNLIVASPQGQLPASVTGQGPKHPKCPEHDCYIGKVIGIVYDRFGDFEGFHLLTQEGREHQFHSREPEVKELIFLAWKARFLIGVSGKPGDHGGPCGPGNPYDPCVPHVANAVERIVFLERGDISHT